MSYKVTPDDMVLELNGTNTVQAVLQNVDIILSTMKGSVPLYREFGVSPDYLHKPLPVAKAMLQVEIREAVERFEPRAEVINVTFREDQDRIIPTVEVNIRE